MSIIFEISKSICRITLRGRSVMVLSVGLSVCACAQPRADDPLTTAGSIAPVVTAEQAARLQNVLDEFVSEQTAVRSGLLLVAGPGFSWKGASGLAFEAAGLPAQADDQFTIDSIAKTMTATVAMKLVEAGRLDLNDRIVEHLPPSITDGLHVFEGRSYANAITVRHLLSHTSGIPDDWPCADFLDRVAADFERHWSPEETVEFVKSNCEPGFPPGGGFQYSDTGYNLLGLIIEGVTGSPLHEVMREFLFEPLGMCHTYRPAYEPPRPSISGRPPSERYFGDVECSLATSVMTADWGGGGLISTTGNLHRFLRAFVDNRIFAETATRNAMLEWIESGPFHRYGFGIAEVDFDRSDNPLHTGLGRVWGHAGSSQNFMYYWPERDMIIIGTLNQIAGESDVYDLAARVLRVSLKQ